MASVEFLQAHSLFGGISDEDLKKIVPHLEKHAFAPGAFILEEGEQGDRIYFIEAGRVEVLKRNEQEPDQNYFQLTELGPGATFGEMELIDIQARSASIRTLTAVRCLTLSNMALYRIYQEEPQLYGMVLLNLAREISRRLRRMNALACGSDSLFPQVLFNPEPPESGELKPDKTSTV